MFMLIALTLKILPLLLLPPISMTINSMNILSHVSEACWWYSVCEAWEWLPDSGCLAVVA